MSLKFEVQSLDTVPDALRSHYVPKDGKFVLDVEGAAPAEAFNALKLSEAEKRENNIKLLKALGADSLDAALQRAGLIQGLDPAKLERLKAIDPDEYAALKAKAEKLKGKGMDDPDAVDTRIKAMLDAALAPVNEKLAASERARSEAQSLADRALLRQTVGDKYLKLGGRPEALDFILERAPFRVVENAVRAQENRFSAAKPGHPLEVDEWLGEATREFGFAFEASKGGGAAPGAKGGTVPPSEWKTSSGAKVDASGIEVLT